MRGVKALFYDTSKLDAYTVTHLDLSSKYFRESISEDITFLKCKSCYQMLEVTVISLYLKELSGFYMEILFLLSVNLMI
jgi:hypothetical protein